LWSWIVETPLTFLQEEPKALFGDTIEPVHMTLRLVSEVLDAVDVVLFVNK